VNRVSDELLARARFASKEDGGVGSGDASHLFVHLAHRAAGADQVREVVALLQLLPQMSVLVDEPLPVRFDEAVDLHRLGNHRPDHAEKLHRPVIVAVGLEPQVDPDCAHSPPFERDRR
jgi:hypothetical protein